MPVEWRKQQPGKKYLDFNWIQENIPKTHSEDMSRGWSLRHPNTTFLYNPTVTARTGLTAITGLMNNLQNRWGFIVKKVDEYIEISPSHPMYQSIVKQKQDIIRQVKEGLAQVDRAISDVELLIHDQRKYKIILDFIAKNDAHSLKAMFIDQVDVNLPEGVSLRSIAPRWPTIIADFMELDDEDDTKEKVQKKLGTSVAEAVVLATKVKLYIKWRHYFGDQVKERYRHILERLYGRKASIEEYRNWIRPLIRRIMQIREVDDKYLTMHKNLPVGIGAPVAFQYIEYWAWTTMEGLEPVEHHKAPGEYYETKGVGTAPAAPFWPHLRIKEGEIPRFPIEPYDDVVKKFIPQIEAHHGIKITEEDVLEARNRLLLEGSRTYYWYVLVHFPISISHFKLPSGLDVEDIAFDKLSVAFLTQNILLVKFLELIAEENKVDAYIDELLGKKVMVDGVIKEIGEMLHEDFPDIYPEKKMKEPEKSSFSEFKESLTKSMTKLQKTLNSLFGMKMLFVKGPYDPHFRDRMTYTFGRPFLREIFNPLIWSYMLKNFGGV